LKYTILFLFLFLNVAGTLFSQTTIAFQDFESSPISPVWNYTVSGSGGSIQTGVLASPGKPLNANKFKNGLASYGTTNGTTILDFAPINSLYLKNIRVEFSLASYSITTANGAEPSDLVEVLVSTDGINFYKEIEVKGNTNRNSWWGFNATGIASRYYSGVGSFGSFSATNSSENLDGYASIILTDLPSVLNLYFRISLKNDSTGELWLIDDVKLTGEDNTLPTLLTSKKSISDINYLVNNGPSVPVNYTLNGINLIPSSENIGIKAPLNFELSLTESSGYVDSLTIPYTGGTVNATQIFSRLKMDLSLGSYGGTGSNIVHKGGGATNLNIKLDGKVSDGLACGTLINIDSVRRTIPVQNSYTGLDPYTVKGKVTGVFGSNKFYIQDSTAGIAVFQSNIVSINSLKIGDWVSLTAVPTRFNGEAEFVSVTCFDKIAGGVIDPPVVFDTNNPPADTTLALFLNINEGKLVKIKSINILNSGTFLAGTNFNLSACNSQGFSEIRVDAGAVSIIGASIPNMTQDIVGLVGRFVSASGGSNKTQIFPRYLSDFQTSTISCIPTGGCGISNYPSSDTTFEALNFNIEWLGDPDNGPTGSGPNDSIQIANAIYLLKESKADLMMLQEIYSYNESDPIDNTTAFGKLIKGLNDHYGLGTYSGECSGAYSYSYTDSLNKGGQRVCAIYKNSVVTKLFSRYMLDSMNLSSYPPTGQISNFWASGRLPFQFMAEVNMKGQKDTVLFVGLHAKAGSAIDDWERRKLDVRVMYDSLMLEYPNKKIMILGDMNDDFDQSIYQGNISSYAPFLYTDPSETQVGGLRPNTEWEALSLNLSRLGCASTATFSDFIDHQIISNEMLTSARGLKYKPMSISSFRPIIANYRTTTSDHYATISTFDFLVVKPPCDLLITFSSNIDDFNNQSQVFLVNKNIGKIFATNKIQGFSNVRFTGAAIELNPGFLVENGAVFTAQTGGCD
jgi:hypothetical protein